MPERVSCRERVTMNVYLMLLGQEPCPFPDLNMWEVPLPWTERLSLLWSQQLQQWTCYKSCFGPVCSWWLKWGVFPRGRFLLPQPSSAPVLTASFTCRGKKLLLTVLLLSVSSKMCNIEFSPKKNSFQQATTLISKRCAQPDTVRTVIVSALNWVWRKSIALFHLWKTGFRSEFAPQWNQFGGLLTQCLGTTGPHHTITLPLLFSLVAFSWERWEIIGEKGAERGPRMEGDQEEPDGHQSTPLAPCQGGICWQLRESQLPARPL